MLTVDQIESIRRAYHLEGKSIRAVARDLGHGRRVIREAISGADPPPRHYRLTKPKARPVLDPVTTTIDRWLTDDQTAPRKQRHSAKRVYDRLVAEHGFTGSERIVRQYVQAWKRAHQPDGEVFLPLGYAPGSEAQCDWGEAVVRVGGVEQVAQVFCLRLCYSVKSFVMAFPTARQECFLTGHAAGFAALGGVPERVTYDNLASAVRKLLEGRNRVEQEQFIGLRSHYLFASHFCLPGQAGAHEKPFAETLVGYARRNCFVPVPEVASWADLNRLLAERCAADDGRTVPGRDRTIGDLWAEERLRLRPLPRHRYPCCRTLPVRATRQQIVRFERNRYSVPDRSAGERLLLRGYPWHIELSDGQTVIARHDRLYGTDGEQLDPLHYLRVLERKPGGFELARPIQRWRTSWPPIYEQYLAALRQARPTDGTREFIRILQLHADVTTDQLATALELALQQACWSAVGVDRLRRLARADGGPVPGAALPTTSDHWTALATLTIPPPDLTRFDRLFLSEEVTR